MSISPLRSTDFRDRESLKFTPFKNLRRSTSLPDLNKFFRETPLRSLDGTSLKEKFSRTLQIRESLKEDRLKKKSGVFWECVDFVDGCYVFLSKPEYDDARGLIEEAKAKQNAGQKNNELYPAVEMTPLKLIKTGFFLPINETKEQFIENQYKFILDEESDFLNKKPEEKKTIRTNYILDLAQLFDLAKSFQFLGYKIDVRKKGSTLFLPTKETIMERWKKEWPIFEILKMKGIAEPAPFIEAYLTHDVILSDEGEFVHDHLIHLIPTLGSFFKYGLQGSDIYKKERARLSKGILLHYSKIFSIEKMIQNEKKEETLYFLEKFKYALSALVDILLSRSEFEHKNDYILKTHFQAIWEENYWINYWNRLFKNEKKIDYKAIIHFCKQVSREEISLPTPLEKDRIKQPNRFMKKMNSKLVQIEKTHLSIEHRLHT
jgi:hypothetical protein